MTWDRLYSTVFLGLNWLQATIPCGQSASGYVARYGPRSRLETALNRRGSSFRAIQAFTPIHRHGHLGVPSRDAQIILENPISNYRFRLTTAPETMGATCSEMGQCTIGRAKGGYAAVPVHEVAQAGTGQREAGS